MSRWFRLDDDVINDPKVLALSEATRWHWVALLCVASKHGGKIPSLHHAAVGLRLADRKAGLVVTELAAAGLLDRVDGGYFEPHNWGGRQFQSDVSTERVKRFREREVKRQRNVSETPPDNRVQKQKIDDGEDASARAPLVSPEATAIAEEVAKIAGYAEPLDWPPGWCGAPMRVQAWLSQGWTTEPIVAAARGAMARKRDGPPGSIQYFERAIAKFIAEQAAPLPTVVHLPAQTVEVHANGKPETLPGTARRLAAAGVSFGPRPGSLRPGADGPIAGLLPQRRGE